MVWSEDESIRLIGGAKHHRQARRPGLSAECCSAVASCDHMHLDRAIPTHSAAEAARLSLSSFAELSC